MYAEIAPSAADVLAAQRVDSVSGVPPSASRARLAAGYFADSDTSASMLDTAAASGAAAPSPEIPPAVSGVNYSGVRSEASGKLTGQHMGGAEGLLPSASQARLADGYAADSDASTQGKRHRAAGAAALAPVPAPSEATDGRTASAAAPLDDVSAAGAPAGNGSIVRQSSADSGSPLSAVEEEPLPLLSSLALPQAGISPEERISGDATAAEDVVSQAIRQGVAAAPNVGGGVCLGNG